MIWDRLKNMLHVQIMTRQKNRETSGCGDIIMTYGKMEVQMIC